ncbi:MAG: AAA family ATPase, partial [Candidatus Pacearchaeota archaeon]
MINLINTNKLYIRNPWWRDSKFLFDEKGWIHRDLYFELEKNMEQPLALSILGLRRVGKSTILKQLINKLFAKGEDSKRVFYYLFDDLEQINTSENLDALLNMYFEQILQEPLHALSSPVYIFFDEIQYVPDWQTILKRYYDLSEKKIKFIISGSQSVLLEGKNKETMAGR